MAGVSQPRLTRGEDRNPPDPIWIRGASGANALRRRTMSYGLCRHRTPTTSRANRAQGMAARSMAKTCLDPGGDTASAAGPA